MSADLEHGFGTGLRAQLQMRRGEVETEPVATPVVAAETPAVPPPLRDELESALARERELRDALQHHVEAHERELAAGRDLALQEAELEQAIARLASREAELEALEQAARELHERAVEERRDLTLRRTELVVEEARIVELGVHIDKRAAELESTDDGQAEASAELARQLGALAERERELKRDRSELDQRRAETLAREEAAGARDRDLRTAETELGRERARLRERVEAVAARETSTDERLALREAALVQAESLHADREATLATWEDRVRAQAERVERERTGHGRASQEAFALLAELERREEALRLRESTSLKPVLREADSKRIQAREQLLARGETHLTALREELDRREERAAKTAHDLAERRALVEVVEQELRTREARLGAETELRAEKLDLLEEEIAERERRLNAREQDLTVYASELQREIA